MSRANLAVEREAIASNQDISLLARLRKGYVKSIRIQLRNVRDNPAEKLLRIRSPKGWVEVPAFFARLPRVAFRFSHALSETARYFTAFTINGVVVSVGPQADILQPWALMPLDDLVTIDAYLRRAIARGWVC